MSFVPTVLVVCPSDPFMINRLKEITAEVLFSRSIILNTPQFTIFIFTLILLGVKPFISKCSIVYKLSP